MALSKIMAQGSVFKKCTSSLGQVRGTDFCFSRGWEYFFMRYAARSFTRIMSGLFNWTLHLSD